MNRIAASTACKPIDVQGMLTGVSEKRASARFGTVNVASMVLLPI